jgi:hypothetical protein
MLFDPIRFLNREIVQHVAVRCLAVEIAHTNQIPSAHLLVRCRWDCGSGSDRII